jgi:hypothetical protein
MVRRDAPLDDAPNPSTAARSYLDELLRELTPARRAAWRPPRILAQLLPQPTKSDRELARFRLEDVNQLSPRRAAAEALQLRVAIALVFDREDVGEIPWIDKRLDALDARAAAA